MRLRSDSDRGNEEGVSVSGKHLICINVVMSTLRMPCLVWKPSVSIIRHPYPSSVSAIRISEPYLSAISGIRFPYPLSARRGIGVLRFLLQQNQTRT